jgi:hypothetical protein
MSAERRKARGDGPGGQIVADGVARAVAFTNNLLVDTG